MFNYDWFHGNAFEEQQEEARLRCTFAHFPDLDIDGDDRVNWAEFKKRFPEAEQKVYEALDLNGDGSVDHDEWHEFKAAHGLKHE